MQNYIKAWEELWYPSKSFIVFHEIAIPYLAKRFFPNKDLFILELGVGTGHCLLPLKKAGYKHLIGIDIDPFSFSFISSQDINFLQADISKNFLPIKEESIDVVILFHLIEHFINAEGCLTQIMKILKQGGLLLLSTPDWRRQYKVFFSDPTHVHPYDKKSILWLLRCFGFMPLLVRNFGVMRGIGRLGIWKIMELLMFTGGNIIAVAQKPYQSNIQNR